MNRINRVIVMSSLALAGPWACAQTSVKDAWVRATVAQQKATGAFMQLRSVKGGKLISAQSPVAGSVEIHEMAMDGDLMKMRAVAGVDLPAGTAVELKPGSYHMMMLDLKHQLKEGDNVQLTLVIDANDGKREKVEVTAPVKSLASSK